MFTEIHYPHEIYPEELDYYLSKGWFRMGQMIFTCRFISFEDTLYTTVWLRLKLEDFAFSKSQRKLLTKNRKRFNIVRRPAIFDEEKEALYQLHKKRFEGYVAKNLKSSLFGEANYNIYNTHEIAIYDNDKLVGTSFFDRGEFSLASIMGMFHPAYSKSSLGYYTMLEEIDFGRKEDFEWYYPGYVVPGYEKFDYKLRIGDVEYFKEDNSTWPMFKNLDHKDLMSNQLYDKLTIITDKLSEKRILNQLWLYPLFDKELFGYANEYFLRNPLFVSCLTQTLDNSFLIVEYDLFEKCYHILQVKRIEDPISFMVPTLFKGYDPNKSYLEFLLKRKRLFRSESSENVIEALEDLNGKELQWEE